VAIDQVQVPTGSIRQRPEIFDVMTRTMSGGTRDHWYFIALSVLLIWYPGAGLVVHDSSTQVDAAAEETRTGFGLGTRRHWTLGSCRTAATQSGMIGNARWTTSIWLRLTIYNGEPPDDTVHNAHEPSARKIYSI
jgi:hypothetical protein